MTPSFNLVDDPWIPTVSAHGTTRLQSLREAIRDAGTCNLAVTDPLEFVALVRRVLLPIVIDTLGRPRSPAAWAELLAADGFAPGPLDAYLDTHRVRFELFDPVAPFDQVANLAAASGETKPAQSLLPAVPTGNNVPLFGSITDGEPITLAPDEAVRAMLVTQCFDTAGIKTGAVGDPAMRGGKTTGNRTGPAGGLGVVIPWSADLYHGLILNLGTAPHASPEDDPPPWRCSPATAEWGTRVPVGLVELLTWQARRIRLVAGADDETVGVTRVLVAAGDRMAALPQDLEPHTMWRRPDKVVPGEPVWRPVRHRSGQALWRGMRGLLALRVATAPDGAAVRTTNLVQGLADLVADGLFPANVRLDVVAVGVEYGNQSAVIENVIADTIPLPLAALTVDPAMREILLAMADVAEELRRATDRLAADVARASGGEAAGFVHGEQVIARLDPLVRSVLAEVRSDPGGAPGLWAGWRTAAREVTFGIAEPLVRSAPPSAFLGRPPAKGQPRRGVADAERSFRRRVHAATGSRGAPDNGEDA